MYGRSISQQMSTQSPSNASEATLKAKTTTEYIRFHYLCFCNHDIHTHTYTGAPSGRDRRSRWGILGDAIAPNRRSVSPRSNLRLLAAGNVASISSLGRPPSTVLEDGGDQAEASGTTTKHSLSQQQQERQNTGDALSTGTEAQNEQLDQLPASDEATTTPPSATDKVASAWVDGQLSELLNSDTPPPPPPAPVEIDDLQVEAARLRSEVDPPPPPYLTEYQEGETFSDT